MAKAPEASPVVEDLPVHPYLADKLHEIATARYPSQVKKMGGRVVFHEIREGKLSLADQQIINDERDARLKALRANPGAVPVEQAGMPTPVASGTAEEAWSPTAGLSDQPVERERDWYERAYKD